MLRDSASNQKLLEVYSRADVDADAASSEIDLQGFGSVAIHAILAGHTGATLDASNKIELEVTESDTSGGVFTAVPDNFLTNFVTGATNTGTFALLDDEGAATIGTSGAHKEYKTSYVGNKRYIKININETGDIQGTVSIGVNAILSKPGNAPVS